MKDRAEDAHISLYVIRDKSYINQLIKNKRFKNPSDAIQFFIAYFKKHDGKMGVKDFMLYMGYPMIFTAFMLYIASTAQKVNETLLENLIISDLILYSQIYFVIGFAWLGILIAGFVFLIYKPKGNK